MVNEPKIYKLKNGLRFLHVPVKSNIISLGFAVKVGARDEDETMNGISHFLEHMLFKKTKNRSTTNLLKDLDSYGAYYNAGTTYEYTAFEIHGNKKDFPKLFDILIDMYLNPKLLKKDLEIERGVITEEYNMGITDIDDKMFDNLLYEIFGNSGLGRPIIGTLDNIQNFTRKDLIGYRNIFYNYLNTIFIVLGNISPITISKMLEKKTKNEKTSNFLNIRQNFHAVQEIPRLNITYTDSLGQIYIMFGFRFDGYLKNNNAAYTEKLVSHIITSGSSSKLWNLLRTKMGVAYYCSSNVYLFEDNSIFTIKSAVDENRVDETIEKILEVLYQIRRGKISSEDIKRAKRIYCNNNEMTMNNPNDLFDYYSSNIIRNFNLVSPKNICSKINNIKYKDVLKTCNNLFRKDNLNLVILGNLKKKQKEKIIDLLDKWYYLS
jgi:predicted Zn-dependent peptidase